LSREVKVFICLLSDKCLRAVAWQRNRGNSHKPW